LAICRLPKDRVLLALLAAAVLLLPLSLLSDAIVSADQQLFLNIWNADGRGSESLCRILTEAGSVYFWAPIVLLLWVFGKRELALYILIAMTIHFFLGAGMKQFIDRPRPFEELAIDVSYHPLGSAFPSGHAMGIATACTMIAIKVKHTAIPMIGAIALVGTSRVLLGVHYPLDVIAAVIIGALLAAYVSTFDLTPLERRLSFHYDYSISRLKGRFGR
jgi:undecaprenyl-diphosphatase